MSELGQSLEGPGPEDLLRRAIDVINGSRPMPLSSSVMISRDEVVELLQRVLAALPEEAREARWLLKDRDAFLDRARAEADAIVAQAGTRAEQMVQRQEVVRAADQRARQIVEAAKVEARRLRLEVEDFCDQRLASFEVSIERVAKAVADGRAKLSGVAHSPVGQPRTPAATGGAESPGPSVTPPAPGPPPAGQSQVPDPDPAPSDAGEPQPRPPGDGFGPRSEVFDQEIG